MANCTFMRPTTPSSFASATDWRSISATTSGASVTGGREQAEPPGWMAGAPVCPPAAAGHVGGADRPRAPGARGRGERRLAAARHAVRRLAGAEPVDELREAL